MNVIYQPEGARIDTPQNREYLSSPAALERAMHDGAVVEGMVTLCDNHMRLHVNLGCAVGIIEPDEALFCRDGEKQKDIAIITRVGKPIAACITALKIKDGILTATLSRRLAQKDCLRHILSVCRTGDLLNARVTHLEPFGAFVDIGCGIPSLLSVDCISVSRIAHPKDRLRTGMELPVVIKSIDHATGRIYVTLRELLGTWEENVANFEAGQTVTGIIRSVESYGIFVELSPNLAGLAELREGCADDLRARIGKSVVVYIKSILPERMKIKLILIDTACAEAPSKKLTFYIDPRQTRHLTHWRYSPIHSHKTIETVFDT